MRILIFHLHDDKFEMGGADRGVLDLASALKVGGDEVHVMTNRGPFACDVLAKGISVIELPRSKRSLFKTLGIIRTHIATFQPEIFHSHHRYTTFLLDLFFKGKGIPILHTQRVQTWDKRFLFRGGDFVAAVSESLRKHMVKYYGVPEKRTRAVINAVALKAPDPEILQSLKIKFPRANGFFYALCSGRFHEQKGHSYLVDAVALLNENQRQKLRVLLAGDGPLETELKLKIREKRLEHNFIFCGYVRDISTYLEFCDFSVLPSLWEGLPRVVLESFFMGRPVVATDIPGTADVMENGVNGLVVRPRDPEDLARALGEILDRPEKLSNLREGARESSKKYSFEAMVHGYQNLYRELIKEKTSS